MKKLQSQKQELNQKKDEKKNQKKLLTPTKNKIV